jgi:aryl-alcohol dehydrogenase-like predicted oxidoreductase
LCGFSYFANQASESDEATSHRLLDDYAKAGGNYIDTADVYSTGVSEEIIGRRAPPRNRR